MQMIQSVYQLIKILIPCKVYKSTKAITIMKGQFHKKQNYINEKYSQVYFQAVEASASPGLSKRNEWE